MAEGQGAGGSRGPALDGRRVAGAAALLAASQVLSRLLGVARDAVLAAQVGAGAEVDAYFAAFQIPDMLNHFLAGGALTIAFIPLFHRARERDGDPGGQRLFGTVLGTTAVMALLATGLVWVFAEPLIAWQFPRFDAEKQALTVRLTRIVAPAQVFFLTGGILRAVLMADGRFGAHALSGLVYNLGIIAGGLWAAPTLGIDGFAWGALFGAIAGPFGLGFLQLAREGRIPFRVAPFDPAFGRYLALAAPLMLGVTLATVDEWYGRWFGGLAAEGTVATLGFARKLMQAPVAVVGQALGTAALPALSQLHASGQGGAFDGLLRRALAASAGLALLAAAAVFALAEPLVRLVYERGAFGAAEAALVTGALRVYTFAIPGFVLQALAARAFYARGEMWRPMLLGTATALLALPLYVAMAERGASALAAAAAVAISVSALLTLGYARVRFGGPALLPWLASAGRSALVAVAAGAATATAPFPAFGAGSLGALFDLLAGASVFGLVALPLAWTLGDDELRGALRRLLARLRRRS